MSSNDDSHLGAGCAGSDAPLPTRLGAPPSADPPSRTDELRARLPLLAGEQHAAERMRTLDLISLAERELVSPAEEVLAIPYLSQRSVMSFLRQQEALPLRAASRASRDAVAEHAWSHFAMHIKGSLASWRRCFPLATAASLIFNGTVRDADLVHLRGIKMFQIIYCKHITDVGFAHLRGIHTLYMHGCTAITDAGLAHLRGIHTLDMSDCPQLTAAALEHLAGIQELKMDFCTGITDAGLLHLRGIRKLSVEGCPQLTAAALAQLEGAVIHR